MRKSREDMVKQYLILAAIGGVIVFWFGFVSGPLIRKGIVYWLFHLNAIRPFASFNSYNFGCGFVLLLLYAVVAFIYGDSYLKNRRIGESGGTIHWESAMRMRKKYSTKEKSTVHTSKAKDTTKGLPSTSGPQGNILAESTENQSDTPVIRTYPDKIFTQLTLMSPNGYVTRKNLNTIVVGGSGAGKTRFFVKPNLLQGNFSYIVLDPKGEILRDTGNAMRALGYKIKVLNVKDMDNSDCYNPFHYLRDDNDIQTLVENFFKSTGGENGQSTQDPFWDNAAKALLTALVSYCFYVLPDEEKNFATVGELLRYAAIKDENAGWKSTLDQIFDNLKDEKSDTFLPPEHPGRICIKFYEDYHSGAAKTLQSIQITLAARLNKFNVGKLRRLTSSDNLDLAMIGQEKTILYCVIPFDDDTYNFLISILYTQLFQQLIRTAEKYYDGFLPIHVDFMMDEFANVTLPKDFKRLVAVIRSYNISVTIILQNLSDLRAIFEKEWESIVGNCDAFLYLGGNEQDTHKYISEVLGHETIFTKSTSVNRGQNGSSGMNEQESSREILKPEEVRMLNHDGDFAILLIRDEYPVLDRKYDILNHPNVGLSADGKGSKFYYNELHITPNDVFSMEDISEMADLVNTQVISSHQNVYTAEKLKEMFISPADSKIPSVENKEQTKASA